MRTNAGYEIIKSEEYATGCEIVLGYNPKRSISPYVTWDCYRGNYHYGHYIEDEKIALYDYHERLMNKYNDEYDLGY